MNSSLIHSNVLCRSFYGGPRRRNHAVQMAVIPDAESEDDLQDSDADEDYDATRDHAESEGSTGESGSSDDDVPLQELVHEGAAAAPLHTDIQWTSAKWTTPNDSNIPAMKLKLKEAFAEDVTVTSSPYTFFQMLFDDDIVEHIMFQTNLYVNWKSQQQGKRAIKVVSKQEIIKALGIILYMGIVKLPDRRMYWARATRIDIIANAMTRNRFSEIVAHMHFNDNALQRQPGEDGYDKLYKLRPFLSMVKANFRSVVEAETYQAIDEMMIPFKGRHGLKNYMPNKPVKWGYKLWCRAGTSGYVYDFEICGGDAKGLPDGVDVGRPIGEYSAVVVRLTLPLQPKKHKVFFDNLFSCPELLVYLRQKQIYAVSTMRENRSRNCPVAKEKDLKKSGRGAVDEKTYGGQVVVCAWLDSKRVLTASNFIGKDPMGECQRYDRKEKRRIAVPRPAIVETYNKFMGGVDKADMLLSLYRTKCRSRKWYIRIFNHLLNLCVVNGWCIYREMGGEGCMKEFLVDIARSLMAGVEQVDDEEPPAKRPVRSLKGSDVPMSIRHDKYNHWPHQLEGQGRCKIHGCNRRTRFMCTKCELYLCVVGSDCFSEFHDA